MTDWGNALEGGPHRSFHPGAHVTEGQTQVQREGRDWLKVTQGFLPMPLSRILVFLVSVANKAV